MVRLPIELSYGCNQEPCGYVNRDSGATHTQNSAGGPFASVWAGKRQFLDRLIHWRPRGRWQHLTITKVQMFWSWSHRKHCWVFSRHQWYKYSSPKRHIKGIYGIEGRETNLGALRHREDWQIRYKDGVAHSQITAGEAHNVNPRGDILTVNRVIPSNWNLSGQSLKKGLSVLPLFLAPFS